MFDKNKQEPYISAPYDESTLGNKYNTRLVSDIRVSDEFVDASIHIENENYRVIHENQQNFIRYHFDKIEETIIENLSDEKINLLLSMLETEKFKRILDCKEQM